MLNAFMFGVNLILTTMCFLLGVAVVLIILTIFVFSIGAFYDYGNRNKLNRED